MVDAVCSWPFESQDSHISFVEYVLSKGQTSGLGLSCWGDFEELPITSSAGSSVNSINPARRHEERDCHDLIDLSWNVGIGWLQECVANANHDGSEKDACGI